MSTFPRLTFALALLLSTAAASAGPAPANTLAELYAQIGACLGPLPLHTGTEMSIRFSLRRDGSLLGLPRVAYLRTTERRDARDADLKAVADAFARCLPARITPALGSAIAGRPFVFSFLPRKPQQKT